MLDVFYYYFTYNVILSITWPFSKLNALIFGLLKTSLSLSLFRFGGFTFEKNEEIYNSRTTEPHVWFNSKGYHALPSYFNSMSNTILRAQLYQGKNKSEYGKTGACKMQLR